MLIKQAPKLVIVRTCCRLFAFLIFGRHDLAAGIYILERHGDKELSLVRFGSIFGFQVNLIALLVQQLDLLL